MSQVYPRCCNLSLEVKSNEGKQLEYTHVIRQGPSQHSGDYGIALAHSMGFPDAVIAEATKMSTMLKAKTEKTFVMDVEASDTNKKKKEIDRLVDVSRLIHIKHLLTYDCNAVNRICRCSKNRVWTKQECVNISNEFAYVTPPLPIIALCQRKQRWKQRRKRKLLLM